ncbi:unnamed protein product [Mytilus edulis]|uniref:B box-type domain-containing protein n=1 Tax=Mytilus edulis TaxID=6550 RepID=A0A8S3Q6F5_MYTED|nr:unnamed protein product [Mytilus edulis]
MENSEISKIDGKENEIDSLNQSLKEENSEDQIGVHMSQNITVTNDGEPASADIRKNMNVTRNKDQNSSDMKIAINATDGEEQTSADMRKPIVNDEETGKDLKSHEAAIEINDRVRSTNEDDCKGSSIISLEENSLNELSNTASEKEQCTSLAIGVHIRNENVLNTTPDKPWQEKTVDIATSISPLRGGFNFACESQAGRKKIKPFYRKQRSSKIDTTSLQSKHNDENCNTDHPDIIGQSNKKDSDSVKNNNETTQPLTNIWSINAASRSLPVSMSAHVVQNMELFSFFVNSSPHLSKMSKWEEKDEESVKDFSLCRPKCISTLNSIKNRKRRCNRKTINKFESQQHAPSLRVVNSVVYCTPHGDVVKYWCHTCGILKCEKCVNVVYSRTCINHSVQTVDEYVLNKKKDQGHRTQMKSSICLRTIDQAMRVLQLNEQQTEFQTLIQKDLIRQEFISFHHLLYDEERILMESIDECLEKYKMQTRMTEQECGTVLEEEAKLMSYHLSVLAKDDPFGMNLNIIENSIQKDWSKIQENVKGVINSIQHMPTDIKNKLSLRQQKMDTMKQLSNARDPFELCPLNFTLYFDGSIMEYPIKVSDLFICKNLKHTFPKAKLHIEVFCGRMVIHEESLNMYDYIFNFDGRPRLSEWRRYLIKARLSDTTTCRNILLITGHR